MTNLPEPLVDESAVLVQSEDWKISRFFGNEYRCQVKLKAAGIYRVIAGYVEDGRWKSWDGRAYYGVHDIRGDAGDVITVAVRFRTPASAVVFGGRTARAIVRVPAEEKPGA